MDYKELRSALLSKGKTSEDRKGHHVFFFVEIDDKAYRATKFSHGAKGQITDDILGAIARQMRLTRKELRNFVDCAVTRDKWLEFWRQRSSP
jgi:hypothetical protein